MLRAAYPTRTPNKPMQTSAKSQPAQHIPFQIWNFSGYREPHNALARFTGRIAIRRPAGGQQGMKPR